MQMKLDAALKNFTTETGNRRLLIVDPSLHGLVGHHFNQARAMVTDAQQQGIPVLSVGYHLSDAQTFEHIPVLPHFRTRPYDRNRSNSCIEEDFSAMNEGFLNDLMRLPVDCTSEDVVFFPTVNQNQLLAIAAWAVTQQRTGSCPRIVLGLMFAPDWSSWGPPDPGLSELYRRAFAAWPPAVRGRLRLLCETEGVAQRYRKLTSMKVTVCAAPTARSHRRLVSRPNEAQMVVGYLGHGRREKGLEMLGDLVEMTSFVSPGMTFHIQLNYLADDAMHRNIRKRLEQSPSVTRLHFGTLDEEAYMEWIDGCDLMLLPYDPIRYKVRGSGLFRETLARGRPVVVPRGTEMGACTGKNNLGCLFEQYTVSSIASALVRAREQRPVLSASAWQWAVKHNASQARPDFVQFLFQESELWA